MNVPDLYVEGELVGISGLWYSTRHYIGKSAEPDHRSY